VLYYWDFNNASSILTPTIGTGSATVTYFSVGVFGGVGPGTGTTENVVAPYSAGSSLQFSNPASTLIDQRVQFGNLSFADADQVQISFAVRSSEIFEVADTFKIRYRALAGVEEGPESPAWTEINWTGDRPTSEWSVRTFTLTGLAGASSAQIQIHTSSLFEVGSVLEFDNVQITAVPEPSTFVLLALAGGAVFLIIRRRAVLAR
jgi:hypothetical protein